LLAGLIKKDKDEKKQARETRQIKKKKGIDFGDR